MKIIYRICHFLLYAYLFVSKLIMSKLDHLVQKTVNQAKLMRYRTNIRLIEQSGLLVQMSQNKKELTNCALIFNQIRHDIELDEITRVTTII